MDYEEALCAEVSPHLFFPEPGKSREAAMAKSICKECPIILECFLSAMKYSSKDDWGVFGGTTEQERYQFRRKPKLKEIYINSLKDRKHE
jgi:WhiB family redox-sensing transcriptional regulator